MTSFADVAVGAPGVPDQGSLVDDPSFADAAGFDDEAGDQPVDFESVKGLVLGAAGILHQSLRASYPERPDIAVMTDSEAERIASALCSMAKRSPGLASVLERSDAASLALVLAGFTGRVTNDIAAVRRERKQDGTDQRQVEVPGRRDDQGSPGVAGQPGLSGEPAGHGGGLH